MEFNFLGRFECIWDPHDLLVEPNTPTLTEKELQNREKEKAQDKYKIPRQIQ